MAKSQRKIISGAAEDLAVGRPQEFDGTLLKARPGYMLTKKGALLPVLRCDFAPDEETGASPFSSMYFLGFEAEKFFAPSVDGTDQGIDKDEFDSKNPKTGEGLYFVPLTTDPTRQSFYQQSDIGLFIEALRKCGFDTKSVNGDDGWAVMDGTYGHWQNQEKPQRPGKVDEAAPKDGEPKRPQTVLVCTEIKDAPKKSKGGSTAKAVGKKAAAPADDSDLRKEVAEFVLDRLGKAKNYTMSKQKLVAAALRDFEGDKAAAGELLGDDDFINSIKKVSIDDDSMVELTK